MVLTVERCGTFGRDNLVQSGNSIYDSGQLPPLTPSVRGRRCCRAVFEHQVFLSGHLGSAEPIPPGRTFHPQGHLGHIRYYRAGSAGRFPLGNDLQ